MIIELNALILITDTIMELVEGKQGYFFYILNIGASFLYYTAIPFIGIVWTFYVDYQIFRNKQRLKEKLVSMSIPAIANGILSGVSMFCNVIFFIDEKNMYHRGDFIFLFTIFSDFYIIYSFVILIKYKTKVQKQHFLPLLSFIFLPFAGSIVQIFLDGVNLVWVSMTVSILVIFINIQNEQLYTDYLTGLLNRRQLDYYLYSLLQKYNDKKKIGGIMVDINSFKQINDRYGHNEGDQALKYTAQILRKSIHKEQFIFRYGGDEFVILMEIDHTSELEDIICCLKVNVSRFNQKSITPYTLSLSIGADFYQTGMTVQSFLKHIDTLMYQDKNKILVEYKDERIEAT
jgi:diguanylate cyclase (GGDEF)-like protein